jgi:hypothetical protein
MEKVTARALWPVLVAVAAIDGCGGDEPPAPAPASAPAPALVSVGQPVSGSGGFELRAAGVGRPPSAAVRAGVDRAARGDRCVVVLPEGLARGEADRSCDVRAGRPAVALVLVLGIPDRLGATPAIVAGVAEPGVSSIVLDGPGGRRELPLSAGGGFLALYAHAATGRARIVARTRAGAVTVLRFSLPVPRRSVHRHRRAGAVFGDEVGELILRLPYFELVRRFGAPAATRTIGGERCAFYEVVGEGAHGWRFCFAAGGRMTGAAGNTPTGTGTRRAGAGHRRGG